MESLFFKRVKQSAFSFQRILCSSRQINLFTNQARQVMLFGNLGVMTCVSSHTAHTFQRQSILKAQTTKLGLYIYIYLML